MSKDLLYSIMFPLDATKFSGNCLFFSTTKKYDKVEWFQPHGAVDAVPYNINSYFVQLNKYLFFHTVK